MVSVWEFLSSLDQKDENLWLLFGLLLLIIPGIFSLFCLNTGLNVQASPPSSSEKQEKEYWLSSDTDTSFNDGSETD